MKILEPLWRSRPETASRVRGRIESILDYAKAGGWRDGENPCRWRGHLDKLLPARAKVRKVEHHAALPWREIGAFMAKLREQTSVSASCLQFLILTACRSGEVLGSPHMGNSGRPHEGGREHRVPLSEAAMAVLRHMASVRLYGDSSALIFPGGRPGKSLSSLSMLKTARAIGGAVTIHGFRSSFRDWCGEATNFPRELAEKALAHALSSAVEAAYQRGDMFEKRRKLMGAWADFCGRPALTGKVVQLNRAG